MPIRPNERLAKKLADVFNNPEGMGFYILCTVHIPFDKLCEMVGYSLMYGNEPAKFFTVGAKKYIPERKQNAKNNND